MPKSADTRQKIIEAAEELFLDHGYSETSLDDVATAAGVTKPTIYSHFGSKEGLLLSMVEAHATARADAISATLSPTGNPREDLLGFAQMFSSRVLSEEANRWHRLALSESERHPEIGRTIFAAGPARVVEALRSFVAGEVRAGRLCCEDAAIAAEQFMGLLVGLNPIRTMTGQKLPSKTKQRRLCEQAVNTFLAAFESKPS